MASIPKHDIGGITICGMAETGFFVGPRLFGLGRRAAFGACVPGTGITLIERTGAGAGAAGFRECGGRWWSGGPWSIGTSLGPLVGLVGEGATAPVKGLGAAVVVAVVEPAGAGDWANVVAGFRERSW